MSKLLAVFLLLAASLSAQVVDGAGRVLAPILFANLGAPTNGTIVYCTDCTATNPAAGSGSGAVARRENGAWNAGGGNGGVTTSVTLTSGLPVIGAGGSAIAVGTKTASASTLFVTSTGTQTASDCVSIDASGNHVANGAPCASASTFAGVFMANAGSNTLLAGTGNICTPSATTECLKLAGANTPSTIHAGALNVNLSNSFGWANATAYGYFTNTVTAERTWTMQDASYIVIGRDTTDTLINKSISFDQITGKFATNAKTATYPVVAADFASCKTIPVASGTFTITLVASGSQPASGQCIDIINYGSGVVTVARSGQNINGATASITLAAGSAAAPTGLHVVSDGTNYVAQPFGAAGGSVSNYYTSTGSTGIGPTSFTPANTFTVYDAGGSGSTNVLFKSGAAQSGNLLNFRGNTANDVGIRVTTNGQLDVLLADQSDFATLSFKAFSFSGGFAFTNSGSKISMGGGGQVSNRARIIQGEGVAPTVSGCGSSIAAGSFANAGVITGITTTGSCTLTLTPGMTVDTGFSCAASNQVTANLIRQTASNTTTATLVGTTVSGDTVAYQCQAY